MIKVQQLTEEREKMFISGKIVIENDMFSYYVEDELLISEKIESYNTYYMIRPAYLGSDEDNINRIFGKSMALISKVDIKKIFDCNNYNNFCTLYDCTNPVQIDVGNINDIDKDRCNIVITVYHNNLGLSIVSDTHSIEYMSLEKLTTPPRFDVIDSYSLKIDGVEYMCFYNGTSNDNNEYVLDTKSIDFFDVQVQKYHYNNFESIASSSIDNETLTIETTSGILNTSLLSLQDGLGGFRLYPLGYKGNVTIKFSINSIVVAKYTFRLI